MYLSKLEIFGFKSFADKTTIEFDSGVSAVVGPNGSGKSNIVDALRWVLGEQGDKILRSGKREDVVFNGTKFRKPLSIAEVAVTIQNNKGKLPTEYSEVQIARRFYRSGDTEYYLNGTRVRLKDIRELFIDTGIGPDAYSVIELKMVETILSDIKHERRKLFEEAAGVVSYKHNRDLTFGRLDAVHETLQRVNDIIREKQRNVNALERQVKRNEEAKIVSEELKSLELKVGAFEYRSLIQEILQIKSREDSNISTKSRLAEEISENDVGLDKLRNEIILMEQNLEKISDDINSMKIQVYHIEKENLVLEEKIRNTETNIARLEESNNNLAASQKRNGERHEELSEKIKVLSNSVLISEVSLNEKKAKVDASIIIINEKKNEIIDLGKKIKEINKEVADNNSEYHKNKIEFDNNLSEQEKLSLQNQQHLLEADALQSERSRLEDNLKLNLDKLKDAQKEFEEKEFAKSQLAAKISESEKLISAMTLELQKITGKIDHLLKLSENFEDYTEGVRYLVAELKNENVATLIDTIDVEDKFKTAIETALGEVSGYLVVNDSSTIDDLINKLKENKKGKVTFILNDEINKSFANPFGAYPEEPDFIGSKGVYGNAINFVKCRDDRYLKLMHYILDEYVIVDNDTTAAKLSADNYYKFITLEGDIFTKGFVRSGGEISEELSKLGRERITDALKNECATKENEIQELKNRQAEFITGHDNISIEIFRHNLESAKADFDRTEREISIIDFKKEQINKAVQANEESHQNIKDANVILNKKINELIEKVNKSENEQYNLDKELIFLTDEFNVIEQNFSQESADFNNFNVEFIKLKSELSNEEQNRTRIANSIVNNERLIESNSQTITGERILLTTMSAKLNLNRESFGKLADKLEEVESGFAAEKTSCEEVKSRHHQIDVDQRGRRAEFDSVSQKLINAQVKIKENEIKSDQVKDYILKKYEKDISAIQSIEVEFAHDDEFDFAAAKKTVEELSERLKQLGGGYQQILFEDFENEKIELEKLVEQKQDLIESEKDIRKTIERINKEARERFLQTFEYIRENFIRIFKELFSEGDEANLRIIYEEDENGVVEDDPLEAKIEIIAKPRGKRPTSIELLSGGEKTLTAIALLFAIYLVKPSPFCVLDEVDAPLDVANLSRFNKMIRKFSENTQFILITHNERTMESVDRLYGVTMQEAGVTTIVETKFKKDEKLQA